MLPLHLWPRSFFIGGDRFILMDESFERVQSGERRDALRACGFEPVDPFFARFELEAAFSNHWEERGFLRAGDLLSRSFCEPGSWMDAGEARRRLLAELTEALERGRMVVVRRLRRSLSYTPRIKEELLEEPSPAAAEGPLRLALSFITASGHAVHDDSGFELVHPDGNVERGTLSEGGLKRENVAPGLYQMRFKYLSHAEWVPNNAHCDEPLKMRVRGRGYPEQTAVRIRVQNVIEGPAEASAELEAHLSQDIAEVEFIYRQPVGAPPLACLRFHATVDEKRASSGPLWLTPYPIEDLRGVQQRLRALGYDSGSLSQEMNGAIERALKDFQESHPPLAADGAADLLTREALTRSAHF